MMVDAMNCDAFDERLSDYLEGELAPADRRGVEAHLASCLRCTALVRDLEAIRADASVLPELVPTRDLWDGIAGRIEARVVPLLPQAVSVVRTPSYPKRQVHRLRFAAAAAALVAVTAAATYMLTMARVSGTSPSEVAVNAQRDSENRGDTAAPPSQISTNPVAAIDTPVAGPAEAPPAPPSAQRVGNPAASSSASREIDRLRQIFIQNRNQLDPRTAAIIEANLKVIDDAIAQSRAALAQDPASEFLNEQLKSAVDKKLELLKTAARLPQRT